MSTLESQSVNGSVADARGIHDLSQLVQASIENFLPATVAFLSVLGCGLLAPSLPTKYTNESQNAPMMILLMMATAFSQGQVTLAQGTDSCITKLCVTCRSLELEPQQLQSQESQCRA